MNKEVKALLDRNNFKVTCHLDCEALGLYISFPKRVQEPMCDEYSIYYLIRNNLILYKIDEDEIEIECPNYAIKTLIFADIKMNCDYLGFDSRLLDFFDGDEIITEAEFFKRLSFGKDIHKEEYLLLELVAKAYNNIIPFHESFDEEAENLGIGLGFKLIKSFILGGKNE